MQRSLAFEPWLRKPWIVATVGFGKHELSNHDLREFQTMIGGLASFFLVSEVFIFSYFKNLDCLE